MSRPAAASAAPSGHATPPPEAAADSLGPHPSETLQPGQAPSAEDTARAQAHDLYDAAQQRFDAGDFQAALEGYEHAYQVANDAHLDTAARVQLAIASANERLGRTAAAISALEEYLHEAPTASDRSDVQARIDRLQHPVASSSTTSSSASSASPASSTTASPTSSTTASTASSPISSTASTSSSSDDDGWYRQVGSQRYDVHPSDAQHLASDLAQYLSHATAQNYDHDRVRVFQRAAGESPDGNYGGATRAALIFWGVPNPPRAFTTPGTTYSAPRRADGTTHPPVVATASVGDAGASLTRARTLASMTAKAITRQTQHWQRRLHEFQRAAGLPTGAYDGRTYNALVFFGIRRPPAELVGPAHTAPEAAYDGRNLR